MHRCGPSLCIKSSIWAVIPLLSLFLPPPSEDCTIFLTETGNAEAATPLRVCLLRLSLVPLPSGWLRCFFFHLLPCQKFSVWGHFLMSDCTWNAGLFWWLWQPLPSLTQRPRQPTGFDRSGKVHVPQAVLNISAWKCCLSKLLLDEPCGNSPLIYFLQLLQWVLLWGILENHLEAAVGRNEVRLAGRSTLCHITRLDLFFSHCFNLFCSLCRA